MQSSLQKHSSNILAVRNENGEKTITVYTGELTPETVLTSIKKIKATFPALSNDFYDIFMERVKDKGFSDQRLKDAVNHVIDTCQYPTPTLANFLSFDKRVKLYDYNQFCSLVTEGKASWGAYDRIKGNGSIYFVSKSDKAQHNIPDEI